MITRFSFLVFLFFSQICFAVDNANIYEFTQAGMLSPNVKNALPRVYVPNTFSKNVSVIDATTYKVIDTLDSDFLPQHVVPSYDMQTLWILNNKGNSVIPIDPNTGKKGTSISVDDPYNMYFTPDGKFAIVVCEAKKQLQLRDPKTMQLVNVINTNCNGANHLDFTVDGKYIIVTCEYSGQLMKVDLENKKVMGYLSLGQGKKIMQKPMEGLFSEITIKQDGSIEVPDLNKPKFKFTSMPQDIRSSSDGKIFFVADMLRDGVVLIDPNRFIEIGFIHTGVGTHAIYPSRDGKLFYVSNRGCHNFNCKQHGPGNVSVVDPIKKKVITTWNIPAGGSPDMGNISADGKELWLSGRYDNEVYVFDTISGDLKYRIPVGNGPHGLTVWPQPGRYSLGHTGNMR